MFGFDLTFIGVLVLSAISAGALAYALLYNSVREEKHQQKRYESVKRAEDERNAAKLVRDRQADISKRRKAVQETLKDLEDRHKTRERNTLRPPLKIQIKQAGLDTSMERFYMYSAVSGVVLTFGGLLIGLPLYLLPALIIVGAVGLPRFVVSFLRKRRVKHFLEEFPNALDIIVRAVKSGLPLNDGIRLIATEAREPVRREFRRIVEAQQIGMPIPEAAMRMTETMPCAEAGFFGIVIQIQSQAGGNLSEALGNLSRVLRDRKKMKAKVSALSMEAKASAVIIGALPVVVAFLVYLTSPTYIMPLFTEPTGNLMLGIGAFWMGIGIFIMRQMMNFEV
ncbi:MAG: type II secretion system F family protein [Rhizobiaceae bacterium]|nr:type II secretion system F family protein [Rhizobiaceae bacterium]